MSAHIIDLAAYKAARDLKAQQEAQNAIRRQLYDDGVVTVCWPPIDYSGSPYVAPYTVEFTQPVVLPNLYDMAKLRHDGVPAVHIPITENSVNAMPPAADLRNAPLDAMPPAADLRHYAPCDTEPPSDG